MIQRVRPLFKGLIFLAGIVVLSYSVLWLYLLGPVGYTPPESTEYTAEPYQVFVYGTLKHSWVRRFIIGRSVDVVADQLEGYKRDGLDLMLEQGAVTSGQRFEVSAAEMKRLDRYERLGVRYQREQVTLQSGHQAWVYRLQRTSDKLH